MLKDLGCSSNAARICELYLTDDLHFKRDFKLVDGSLSEVVNFVLGHTGLQADLLGRFRSLFHIFRNGDQIANELILTRCHRGADIALSLIHILRPKRNSSPEVSMPVRRVIPAESCITP